jgi:RNA polymerase sigma factor (sigma-70 family)
MIAVLTRIFGADRIDLVEDVVQEALLRALELWRFQGIPDNPTGWLYTIAKRRALDLIRREETRSFLAEDIAYLLRSEYAVLPTLDDLFSESAIQDDLLRMMFTCCDPRLPPETQVALILKILCGFSTHEIASAFIVSEETVAKRIYRGKMILRNANATLQWSPEVQTLSRLGSVLTALYLLFNEGYSSAKPNEPIRRDLIDESLRLTSILCEHTETARPEVHAFAALLLLHSARVPSRLDSLGYTLALEDQDRSLWNQDRIKLGLEYLERSALGEALSEYHLQAAIAALHCTAASLESTDWREIVRCYDLLLSSTASPVVALNRAIAISRLEGPERGLTAIHEIDRLDTLKNYSLLPVTLGELHALTGRKELARSEFEHALTLASTPNEREVIERKIQKL